MIKISRESEVNLINVLIDSVRVSLIFCNMFIKSPSSIYATIIHPSTFCLHFCRKYNLHTETELCVETMKEINQ